MCEREEQLENYEKERGFWEVWENVRQISKVRSVASLRKGISYGLERYSCGLGMVLGNGSSIPKSMVTKNCGAQVPSVKCQSLHLTFSHPPVGHQSSLDDVKYLCRC